MPRILRSLPERAFCARARVVAGLFCAVCFTVLVARLFYLQIVTGDWYAERAAAQQLRDTVVPADRGKIYSADGVLLAANSSCWTIRASPREIADEKVELAAHGLAEILELDEAGVLEKFSQRSSNDCLLRYRVDRATAEAVRAFCEENQLTGILINQDSKRWYPEGEFLASVLGFTNVDNAGVSGLELEYNDVLTGENGLVLTASNAWGYTLEHSYVTEQPPTEGNTLVLTIDANIQHYLENALNYAVQEHNVAARSVGIVMDVNTGAVLAMSTTPSYDPNQPRVIYDEAAREAVNALSGEERAAALQLAQQTQWRNKAVSDLYEPGSVFKLITCAAALDAGAISPNSTFVCGESISVSGTRFHCANHKQHGLQTVTEALMNSCNQSFIQIGARLGKEAFCDYFAAFGLREATGIDLPAEPSKSLFYTADKMGPMRGLGYKKRAPNHGANGSEPSLFCPVRIKPFPEVMMRFAGAAGYLPQKLFAECTDPAIPPLYIIDLRRENFTVRILPARYRPKAIRPLLCASNFRAQRITVQCRYQLQHSGAVRNTDNTALPLLSQKRFCKRGAVSVSLVKAQAGIRL